MPNPWDPARYAPRKSPGHTPDDPFGSTAAYHAGPPTPTPDYSWPAPLPEPTGSTAQLPAAPTAAGDRPRSPGAVFTASWLFAGIGAFVLSVAIAALVAIPEFQRSYDHATVLTTSAAGAAVLLAAAIGWLAVQTSKAHRSARLATSIGCALTASLPVIAFTTGTSALPWFTHLTRISAVTATIAAAAALALLYLPTANSYFREPARRAAPLAAIPSPGIMALPADQFDPFA